MVHWICNKTQVQKFDELKRNKGVLGLYIDALNDSFCG